MAVTIGDRGAAGDALIADYRIPQTREGGSGARRYARHLATRSPARPTERTTALHVERTWIVVDYATCEATRTRSGLRRRDFCGTHSKTKLLYGDWNVSTRTSMDSPRMLGSAIASSSTCSRAARNG